MNTTFDLRGKFGVVHGQSKSPTYISWTKMKERCNNPKATGYKYWGGRGIQVCERWNLFINFLVDMGERPEGCTIDRIDNNGNYEPNNCRWATKKEQHANQRHGAGGNWRMS